MSKSLNRTAAAFLLAFFLLALTLGRWSIASSDLTARDDNPRRVFEEQLIRRGSIVDRGDRFLTRADLPRSQCASRMNDLDQRRVRIGVEEIDDLRSGRCRRDVLGRFGRIDDVQ